MYETLRDLAPLVKFEKRGEGGGDNGRVFFIKVAGRSLQLY